ncbi:MAG: lipopolysaccharide assembly protein LapA domain-containing protein [Acidimicrobiales bacterium]
MSRARSRRPEQASSPTAGPASSPAASDPVPPPPAGTTPVTAASTPPALAPEAAHWQAPGPVRSSPTRASTLWAALGFGLLLLLAIAIFVLQNGQKVKVTFLGFHGLLPLAVALLLAAVLGGMVVLLMGIARMAQLRLLARRTGASSRGGKPLRTSSGRRGRRRGPDDAGRA